MTVTNFTVNFDLFASANDSTDVGADADVVPLVGVVTFTPQLADDKPIISQDYLPRPAGLKLRPFTGYVDSDGQLKASAGGPVGVRLWANDPVLGLEHLYYRVSFNLTTPAGQRVKVEGGQFEAPSTDTTVNLANVLSTTSSQITGVVREQGYSEDIMDSGLFGRLLLQTQSNVDAWSRLGTVPSQYLPGAVDSVLEFATVANFPATGEASRIYVDLSTNSTYRWGGTTYVRLSGNTVSSDITDSTATGRSVLTAANASAARAAIGAGTSSLELGTTSSTAKAGDYQPASTNITDSTATGRALVTAASAAAARTTLQALRTRPGWFDVRDYGAVGDGVTNDRVAINNAILAAAAGGAGGTIFLPRGVWAIAETGSGISYINFDFQRGYRIILQGEGAGDPFTASGNVGGTTIKGNTGTGPIIRWNDGQGFSMRDIRLVGSKGAGATTAQNGIQMDKTNNPTNLGMEFRNVNVFDCGGSGFFSNSPVVFTYDRCFSMYNNVHGFHFQGGNLGTVQSCWAGGNAQYGFYVDGMAYTHFVSSGADGNNTGWYLKSCQGTVLTGTGSENNTVDAMVIDACWACTVEGTGFYENHRYGVHVKGDSRGVRLAGIRETAGTGAVYSIYTQSTLFPVTVQNYVCSSPTNIAYTDTELQGGRLKTWAVNAIGLNAQTGTAYTIAAGDAGVHVTLSNANPITLTVPTNAAVAFPTGTRIRLSQLGVGQVTVTGASGVTVNGTPGLKISARYASAELTKVGTDSWLLTGSLSA